MSPVAVVKKSFMGEFDIENRLIFINFLSFNVFFYFPCSFIETSEMLFIKPYSIQLISFNVYDVPDCHRPQLLKNFQTFSGGIEMEHCAKK